MASSIFEFGALVEMQPSPHWRLCRHRPLPPGSKLKSPEVIMLREAQRTSGDEWAEPYVAQTSR